MCVSLTLGMLRRNLISYGCPTNEPYLETHDKAAIEDALPRGSGRSACFAAAATRLSSGGRRTGLAPCDGPGSLGAEVVCVGTQRLPTDHRTLSGENRHICAFFNSMDEHYRVLGSFIKDGFDQGDRAFHLVDPERRRRTPQAAHRRGHRRNGGDGFRSTRGTPVARRPAPRRSIRSRTYGWRGSRTCSRPGSAAGYAQTRFLAQMEWALVDLPGVDDLIEFETRVNYVVPKYDDAGDLRATTCRSSERAR